MKKHNRQYKFLYAFAYTPVDDTMLLMDLHWQEHEIVGKDSKSFLLKGNKSVNFSSITYPYNAQSKIATGNQQEIQEATKVWLAEIVKATEKKRLYNYAPKTLIVVSFDKLNIDNMLVDLCL